MKSFMNLIDRFRQNYWGDLFYRCMKYSPVAYYGFLALVCLLSAILGKKSISQIVILPYVYSFIAPAILLAVILVIRIIATILYRDRKFFSNGLVYIIFIYLAIVMAYLPYKSGLYGLESNPSSFRWVDFLLITLALWDLAIKVLFSSQQSEIEEVVAFNWLGQLTDVVLKSLLYQFLLMSLLGIFVIFYEDAVRVLEIQDARIGMWWLAVGYLSIALIRLFTIDSGRGFVSIRDSILRKLLERDIDLYAKKLNIREKEVSSIEDEKDR
jgi:hypothetical protein